MTTTDILPISDILNALDFKPACEAITWREGQPFQDCPHTALWLVTYVMEGCDHSGPFMFCDLHKEYTLAWISDLIKAKGANCSRCKMASADWRYVGVATGLLRVEPI